MNSGSRLRAACTVPHGNVTEAVNSCSVFRSDGSPRRRTRSEQISGLDRWQILNNAQREAWGFKVDASNSLAAADHTRRASRSAGRQTLLTTAAHLYAMPKPSLNRSRVNAPLPAIRLTLNANSNELGREDSNLQLPD